MVREEDDRPAVRRKVLGALVARDFCGPARRRSGTTSAGSSTLEARAPLEGFWVESDTPTVADVAIFGQLHGLRTPLTAAQGRELALRPALTDWLDRVDAATFPGRARVGVGGGLTAPRGHDMTRAACPSPIPTHAQA